MKWRELYLIDGISRIDQRDLAWRVGIGSGAVHTGPSALGEKSLIELDNFSTSRSEREYISLSTLVGIPSKAQLSISHLRHKSAEFQHLEAEKANIECESTSSDHAGVKESDT